MDHRDLSLDEKLMLVKGMGNWHTNGLGGKLPSIHLSDGPHGLRAQKENAKSNNDSIVATCFPTACTAACSFDRELIREMSSAIAEEAKAANVSVLLGPGVNMKRSPLCGRNFEYYSEDPYLTGELASAYVMGVQEQGVATSLKHFAANSQETHRMTSNSVVDERTLREIYLRAFEKVVKAAHPATVMASYNMLNGSPACANKWLLTDVLREEWGYKGLVMSDWGACVDTGACLQAGMDLEMPDPQDNHRQQILYDLKNGSLSEETLNKAVDRVMRLTEQYTPSDTSGLRDIPESLLDTHRVLARRIIEESAVLLRNDGILPLQKPKQVVVLGDLAQQMRVQGGGSSHIHTKTLETIPEVLLREGIDPIFYRGYDSNTKERDTLTRHDEKLADEAIREIKAKLSCDPEIPILVFGGLTDQAEGEGYDRETLSLPLNQRMLYRRIQELCGNIIFISFGGSPYDMSDVRFAKAILCMYLGGACTAQATIDLLFGRCNPSGRLAETWPLSLEDTPCFRHYGRRNATPDNVLYTESIFIGYRYYDTFRIPVQYPFGYGLSYTGFAYRNMKFSRHEDLVRISVEITNTGTMPGSETVLVFVKNAACDRIRANRELRGFSKVYLTPRETKTIEITLDERAFDLYDTDRKCWVTIPGEYQIEISRSVGDVILSQAFIIVENGSHRPGGYQAGILPSYSPDHQGERFSEDEFAILYGKPIPTYIGLKPGQFTAASSLSQMAPYSFLARLLLKIGKPVTRIMTGKPSGDPEYRMLYEGIAEGSIDSVCNQSGGIISRGFIEKIIAQANKER